MNWTNTQNTKIKHWEKKKNKKIGEKTHKNLYIKYIFL